MNQQLLFSGFSIETFAFLRENRMQNSKDWFEKNKPTYESYVFAPLRALVTDLAPTILSIDEQIEVTPAINKTISRIYRDTRFSKDKSLFREDIWISFKRRLKPDFCLPEFYFYATPQHYEYGMGYYAADKKAMDQFKEAIIAHPGAFREAIAFTKSPKNPFAFISEKYKRGNTTEVPEEFRDWMLVKTFHFPFKREFDDSLFSGKLVGEMVEGYNLLGQLYQFIVNHSTGNL
ncbi:DUF2461 domain-containing protein [candidate division KSB1 bacterium]|nr:DUF2461 domain-containing protein [candidate division KSB1 bacterium]